jgi:hypothetical protein
MEKKYTKEQIVNFNPEDWVWRRSSGYGGYDHKDFPKNEQKWIYESDYFNRKHLQEKYKRDYAFLEDFLNSQFAPVTSTIHLRITDYLDQIYFIEEVLDCEERDLDKDDLEHQLAYGERAK